MGGKEGCPPAPVLKGVQQVTTMVPRQCLSCESGLRVNEQRNALRLNRHVWDNGKPAFHLQAGKIWKLMLTSYFSNNLTLRSF